MLSNCVVQNLKEAICIPDNILCITFQQGRRSEVKKSARGAQGWPLFADYFFTYLSLIGILAVILE